MMDFPKDKKVLEMDTEYMFGRNFLVRPVTDSLYTWQDDKQNGYQKNMNKIGKTDVYLPAGAQWIDFWTGKSLKGFQRYQPFFQYIYEEAFFQGKQELLLLSPTGEQESISITAFKELMNLLEVYGGEEEN